MPALRWLGIEGLDGLHKAIAEIVGDSKRGAVAYIGTNLTDPPYPYFLEYGTSRMPAHPSARPAYDERREQATKTAADVLAQLTVPGGPNGPDIMRLAAMAGALEIANRWKELAPYRTGTYRRSIHVEAELVDDVAGVMGQ